jgi:hypothetical protein
LTAAHYHGGHPPAGRRLDWGQVIKWTVYGLLLINFFYYFFEEMYIASHTLRQGGTLLQWMEELATSIDELGWFGLLFMFEMETYTLSDATLERRSVRWSIHGIRLVCYIMLAHTVFARITTVSGFEAVEQATEVTNLCQVADREISFGENYRYTIVDQSNCTVLSRDNTFFYLDPSVITDTDGYNLERKHVWVDLNDAVVWLLVVWAIELAVWLQNRDITGGRLMLATHAAKVFYAVLFMHAGWWAFTGHWVYSWDQFLWIAGFWAIEMNLSEWREEIREEEHEVTA